jgi:hypothetical protein
MYPSLAFGMFGRPNDPRYAEQMQQPMPQQMPPQMDMPPVPQMQGAYDPNEPMNVPFGLKMNRGQVDYMKDLGAGIGKAFDNPVVQALSYANERKDQRRAYDREGAQQDFSNQLEVRKLMNEEEKGRKVKWQLGSMYDDSGREQKIMYNESDPSDYRPLGGQKKPELGALYKIVGKGGEVVYESAENAQGKTPYEKPDRAQPGFSVRTNPDGSTEFVYGESAGLTSSNQTRVQGDIINAQDGIARLDSIARGFKPEYQQLGTRLGAAVTAGKEKLGIDVNPADQKVLQDFTQYKREAIDNLNLRIKELTGAAMGVQEADRIIASLPNPGQGLTDGDSPTQFKSKLDGTIRSLKEVEARRIYTTQKGIQPSSIPLGSMGSVIDKRGDEIAEQVRKSNPGADERQIEQVVEQQLKREFGI